MSLFIQGETTFLLLLLKDHNLLDCICKCVHQKMINLKDTLQIYVFQLVFKLKRFLLGILICELLTLVPKKQLWNHCFLNFPSMKVMLWSDRPINKLCILVTRSGLFVKLKSINVLVWVVLVGLIILWCDLYLDAIILSFFLFVIQPMYIQICAFDSHLLGEKFLYYR